MLLYTHGACRPTVAGKWERACTEHATTPCATAVGLRSDAAYRRLQSTTLCLDLPNRGTVTRAGRLEFFTIRGLDLRGLDNGISIFVRLDGMGHTFIQCLFFVRVHFYLTPATCSLSLPPCELYTTLTRMRGIDDSFWPGDASYSSCGSAEGSRLAV